jgi:hypothetical protein
MGKLVEACKPALHYTINLMKSLVSAARNLMKSLLFAAHNLALPSVL